jgi:crotonobetainyl-CoA:carnitine CoA-transferase CaiB-like acyl-CoA transferase
MRAKAIARLGLGYESVAGVAPAIVYCGVTGYGQRGRYRDKPAYDDVIQAGCGLVFLQAEQGGQPQYVTTVVADKVTGLMALSGILMALFHRSRTGKGQAVAVPMFETMASFVLAEHICGQAFDPPLGPAVYRRLTAAARKPYRTRDGFLSVIVYTDRQWQRFLRLAGRADLADDPRLASFAARTAHVDFAYELIESIIATRTSAAWIDALEDADIPVMPVLSTDQLFVDPHLDEARMIDAFATAADGDLRLPRTPIELSQTPAAPLSAAPELGQHSRQILVEAGYGAADAEGLVARMMTAVPPSA